MNTDFNIIYLYFDYTSVVWLLKNVWLSEVIPGCMISIIPETLFSKEDALVFELTIKANVVIKASVVILRPTHFELSVSCHLTSTALGHSRIEVRRRERP